MAKSKQSMTAKASSDCQALQRKPMEPVAQYQGNKPFRRCHRNKNRSKKRALSAIDPSQSIEQFIPLTVEGPPEVRIPTYHPTIRTCFTAPQDLADGVRRGLIKSQDVSRIEPGLGQDCRPHPAELILDLRSEKHPKIPLIRLPGQNDIDGFGCYVRKGRFPFLDLPGEIRNRIYDLTIPKETFALHWYRDSKKTKGLTHRLPLRSRVCSPKLSDDTIIRRKTLRGHPRNPERALLMQDFYKIPSAVSLLWVCRTMYQEASSIFYSKSVFQFYLLRTLRVFLDNLSTASLRAVTTLHIHHSAYCYPRSFKDIACKYRADLAWENICHRIARDCTSLAHLALDLNYHRAPLRFQKLDDLTASEEFGTRWLYAIWGFQDIDLKSCWLRIRSDVKEDTVLEVESQMLRRQILDDQWDEEEQARYDAFGTPCKINKPRREKTTILRITDTHHTGQMFGMA